MFVQLMILLCIFHPPTTTTSVYFTTGSRPEKNHIRRGGPQSCFVYVSGAPFMCGVRLIFDGRR